MLPESKGGYYCPVLDVALTKAEMIELYYEMGGKECDIAKKVNRCMCHRVIEEN